jgi:hypothetical protein
MYSTFYELIVKVVKTCDISGSHGSVNEAAMPTGRDPRQPHIPEEHYLI